MRVTMNQSLRIRFSDLWRTTLDDGCGNVGFIGISADGREYHVVVPVDIQIARGVKGGNRPIDGTPFGGYRGWRYFQCRTYPACGHPALDSDARRARAEENGRALQSWAGEMDVALEIAGPGERVTPFRA
jgi:hypothetical protein